MTKRAKRIVLKSAIVALAFSAGIVGGTTAAVQAASITMASFLGVNPGTAVPDFSDFEPGGSREGETPVTNLVIETAGLDSSNSAQAEASVSDTVGPNSVYDFARAGIRYTNESNHAFDVFDIFFDFNVSGFLVFDGPFEKPPLSGTASAVFKRNDGGAGPGTSSFVFMSSDLFAPPYSSDEFILDAFTASVPQLRLEAGESATFVVDLEARAAVIPLPPSGLLLAGALGWAGWRARKRIR